MSRILSVLLLLVLGAVSAAAEDGRVSTWRGPGYDGVMPARDLPTEFVWYDADGPDLADSHPADSGRQRLFVRDFADGRWPSPGTRTNACWRAPLPSWGQSAPVVVGDKVFVTCDAIAQTDGRHLLVCVDIGSGAVDWVRPIDHLLAWTDAAAAAEIQAIREHEVDGWAAAMRWWNRVWWDNERHVRYGRTRHSRNYFEVHEYMRKPHPDRQAVFDAAREAGYEDIDRGYWRHAGRFGHRERNASWWRAGRSRARVYSHNKEAPWYGGTFASPVGDGEAVYAVAAPDAVVCYELDGTLRWAADLETGGWPPPGQPIHRNIASPILIDGTLIYLNTSGVYAVAFDCRSGKRLWRTVLPGDSDERKHVNWDYLTNKPRGWCGHMGPNGTPVPMLLRDGEARVPAVVLPSCHVLRAADGAVLGWFETKPGSPYGCGVAVDDIYVSVQLAATRLWLEDGELRSEQLWHRPDPGRNRSNGHSANTSLIATADSVITSGGLELDLASGAVRAERLRPQWDKYTSGCMTADGLLIWHGGSWTQGDDLRFNVVDRNDPKRRGVGLIVEGSYEHKDYQQRIIDRFGTTRIHLGWPHATAAGNRFFIRTNAYLYCFGDPSGDYRPPAPVASDGGRRERARRRRERLAELAAIDVERPREVDLAVLFAALADDDFAVRQRASVLAVACGTAAVPGLSARLTAPDRDLAVRAAEALRCTDASSPALGAVLGAALDHRHATEAPYRWRVSAALARLGRDAAPAKGRVIANLRLGDRRAYRLAGDADLLRELATLAPESPELVPEMVHLLQCRTVVRLDGSIDADLAGGDWPLAEIHDTRLNREGAYAFLRAVGPTALDPLFRRLAYRGEGEENMHYTRLVVDLIGHGGEASCEYVPWLLEQAARSKDPGLRRVAIEALGELGPVAREAVPTLVAVVRHPQPDGAVDLQDSRQRDEIRARLASAERAGVRLAASRVVRAARRALAAIAPEDPAVRAVLGEGDDHAGEDTDGGRPTRSTRRRSPRIRGMNPARDMAGRGQEGGRWSGGDGRASSR